MKSHYSTLRTYFTRRALFNNFRLRRTSFIFYSLSRCISFDQYCLINSDQRKHIFCRIHSYNLNTNIFPLILCTQYKKITQKQSFIHIHTDRQRCLRTRRECGNNRFDHKQLLELLSRRTQSYYQANYNLNILQFKYDAISDIETRVGLDRHIQHKKNQKKTSLYLNVSTLEGRTGKRN